MKNASDTLYVLLRGFCESYFNTPCHSEDAARQQAAMTSFIVFLSLCIILFVPLCGNPILTGDTSTQKQAETEKELIEQYEKQQGLYEKLQKEFDSHPVTKWKQEIDRNKKAIAVLDKQLRDMVRLENEEQIEELRRNNEELQEKIEAKKDEWEGLKKKLDDAKKRLESLKK